MGKVSVDKLTEVFLKIKDKREELSAKFKEEDEALKEQQEKIKRALLDYCRDNGVESTRTAAGTFFRQIKKRYWTSDWEAMHRFIIDNEVPEFLDKRLNQGNVQKYLDEHGEATLPGLNIDSEYVVTVRRSKKGE